MIGWFALALALALQPAPPASRPSVISAAVPGDAALALARSVVTIDDISGRPAADRVRNALAEMLKLSPEAAAIERQYPGAFIAMADAALPITLESSRTQLPDLHARLAALYERRLSPTQIAAASAFLSSPPGQRFARARRANHSDREAIASVMRSADGATPDPRALAADRTQTIRAALASLDASDRALVEEARTSGPLEALEAVDAEAAEIEIDWALTSLPGEDEETERAMTTALQRHLAGATGQKTK